MTQLYKGSTGADVLALQTKLRDAGFYKGALDSSFGPQTDAALRAFQQAAGIKVDGYYGPQSAQALLTYKPGGTTGGTTTTPTTLPNTAIPAPGAYNPSGMTGSNAMAAQGAYKENSSDITRQISEAMNRRGIYGSTIMQYDLDKNTKELKTNMDNAWRSAWARGYATNDEAAILGLTPGKRLRPEDKASAADKQAAANLKVYTNTFNSEFSKAKEAVKKGDISGLYATFDWLTKSHDEGRLSDDDLAAILSNPTTLINGRDPLYYYEQYVAGLEAVAGMQNRYNYDQYRQAQGMALSSAQTEAERAAQQAIAPYQQIVKQESRWGY